VTEPADLGPVEREARQLVEAAARWLSAVPDPTPDTTDRAESDPVGPGTVAEAPDAQPGGAGQGEYADGAAQAAGPGSGEEHLCRGCPWCRAKAAFGGHAGADALDSLAHLLGAAAESLALFAQARREAAAASDRDPEEGPEEGPEKGSGRGPERSPEGCAENGPAGGGNGTTDDGHEEDEGMLEAVIWVDEEDDEEAAEERRRSR